MNRLARVLRLAACLLTVSLAAGCGDACLSLAQQICICLPDDGTRAACNQRAKDSEQFFTVRPNDEQYCQSLLDSNGCNCNLLQSAQGKIACGLQYPTTTSAPGAASTPQPR